MIFGFPTKRLTPIHKQIKSPLKQQIKPQRLSFRTSPCFKTTLPIITPLSKNYSNQTLLMSQNSTPKLLSASKLNKMKMTPEKPLQFSRRNSMVKNQSQNMRIQFPAISKIKRVPLMFMDMNSRKLIEKDNMVKTKVQKSRSHSFTPVRYQFSRNHSRECPQQQIQVKNFSYISSFREVKQQKLTTIKKAIIIDDFYIGKLLGKGYFGQVFIVKHKHTGFVCALKILSKQKIRTEKVEQSLLRQIKIHSFVNHQNVITMYSVFEDLNNVYILQQLAAKNLYSILNKQKNLPETEAIPYISQILKGLKYLHSQDIIHRDIKPQNVLICYDGRAKICDFGWAIYDPIGMRKSNIGTLLYLSPQNILGNGYDNKNDIWAVGILAYQLLTGSIPFNIWVEQEKSKILTDDINFPEYLQISKRAQKFILRMLQKQPEKRASIAQLLQDGFLNNL